VKIDKATRRDRRSHRNQHGMRISGRSVLLLQDIINDKAVKARAERKRRKEQADAEA
jgi:hypothetical protein